MITKEQARREVERKLASKNLTKPMKASEVYIFTAEMYKELQFRSKSDALQDIRTWTERWMFEKFRKSY